MQVSKWGNSLAIRLPASVVKALELREGDEIEVLIADEHIFQVRKKPSAEEPPSLGFANFGERCPPISSSIGKTPMPEPKAFIDSNILLYLLSADEDKADRAKAIVQSEDMQDRLSIDNQLCIRNPFATQASSGLRDLDA
jgi:bifunctional DNA-binding transcriptional regulator/antitoxin component of YhaV-PrlF toxin-antitoxin module